MVTFHTPQCFNKLKVLHTLLLVLFEPFPNTIRNDQLCVIILSCYDTRRSYLDGFANQTINRVGKIQLQAIANK